MIKRLVLMLLVLTVTFGGIFAWKYRQQTQSAAAAAKPPPPVTVASARVVSEKWDRRLSAVGSLVADQGLHVSNEVAGTVAAITFASGQEVRAGTPLLQLDASVDRAELEGRRAELALARLQYQRSAELLRDHSLSRADYDVADATLQSAKAAMASKHAFIEKKTIRAPFDGLLGIRLVDVGQYLAAGSRIALLQSLDPIHVDYTLPERHFDAISPGQQVFLAVEAYPGELFDGRVSALNPGIDPGTRTLRVRATLSNRNRRLRPGMFAEVQTIVGEPREVLTLPRTAVAYNPYGDAVFLIQEHEASLNVERRQVKTGAVRGARVAILDGLAEGNRVVAAGHVKLRNGQRVRIDDSVKLGHTEDGN